MKPKLLIGTPAYGCMIHIDYFNSMTALLRGGINAGIETDFCTIGNSSLVPKARNEIISYFYYEDYTHLIFVDADMGIPNDCVPKLLRRNVDIVGVPVPLKGYDENGNPLLNVGELTLVGDGLATTTHIGTAVFMLSKKAVVALCDSSEKYENDPRYTRGNTLITRCFDAFKIGVFDGVYLPEDYSTCRRLRDLGFEVYVDLTIPVKHNGMHGFVHTDEQLKKLINVLENEEN